ncbi:MAG: hypothetical protein M0Z50_16930 [Planctomycetia bacterium]|nr:hypothetical protein [Planctomycetia bacterium]
MKLRKCILLLPTAYNDGTLVPEAVVNEILAKIDKAFDGHTIDGNCEGSYRMDDGTMSCDKSLKVWVAVDPGRVEKLRGIAASIANKLKQESLYFEVTNSEIEFVRPSLIEEVQ